MINKYKILSTISFFSPIFAFAQSINLSGSTFTDIMTYLNATLRILNPILFSIVFIVFFWGLSKFILNSDNEEEISKGKNYMMWGIIVLFILISFRAIISFVTSDLGLGSSSSIPIIRTNTP